MVLMCLSPKIRLFQSRSAFSAGSGLHPIGHPIGMMERGEGGKVELEGQEYISGAGQKCCELKLLE